MLFVSKYYGGKIPNADENSELWNQVREHEKSITDNLEWANLKDAFHEIFTISDIANKAFQAAEPWKTRTTEPEKAAELIHNLCYVIKDLMIMAHPYMPQYTQKVMSFFGKSIADGKIGKPAEQGALTWSDLGNTTGLTDVGATSVYFTPMDQKTMLAFRERFAGSQKDRNEKNEKKAEKKHEAKKEELPLATDMPAHFNKYISLKVAKIVSVENNPEGDKLYIEHLDDGSGTERIIQSGLRAYLTPDQLLGKHIILAANLAPRTMRGVTSRGMLLAADYKDENGKDCVEPLEAPWAAPGTEVVLEGADIKAVKETEISADVFFQVEIKVNNHDVMIADKKLIADGKPLTTKFTVNSGVN